ncbi:hypothetical protein N7513_004790 [Penicillium frequentans]|nr:hypothetical protein N7513_004790 [Penicillium glabrum]
MQRRRFRQDSLLTRLRFIVQFYLFVLSGDVSLAQIVKASLANDTCSEAHALFSKPYQGIMEAEAAEEHMKIDWSGIAQKSRATGFITPVSMTAKY